MSCKLLNNIVSKHFNSTLRGKSLYTESSITMTWSEATKLQRSGKEGKRCQRQRELEHAEAKSGWGDRRNNRGPPKASGVARQLFARGRAMKLVPPAQSLFFQI